MAKDYRKTLRAKPLEAPQHVKPPVPEDEVEDYAHPSEGTAMDGHHETMGYDPYWGTWDRACFGNERFLPDPWEYDKLTVKRPDDGDHDYDSDHND